MTRSRIRSASLAACLLLSSALIPAPASAQNAGATQGYAIQRQVLAPRAAEAMPLTTSRPRYIVEAISMHADDETGPDWPGADEIVAQFASEGHSMETGVYGDFDTGETKTLRSAQRCMYGAIDPDNNENHSWGCDPNGRTGAIDMTVTIYETDGAARHFLLNSGFCIRGSDLGGDCRYIDSTVVGRFRQIFSEAELSAALPSVGASIERTMQIDNCSEAVTIDGAVCGYSTWLPTYASYTLRYRVTRTADQIVPAGRTMVLQ